MVRKPGKVLCCMFLFAILGVDFAQKPGKGGSCAHTNNQKKHCDYAVPGQSMRKKNKIYAGSRVFRHKF